MSKIFLNGKFVDEADARVSVRTHALQYGTGCFEGIRAYYSEKDKCLYAFRLKEHYERLLLSCRILMIKLPYGVNELCKLTVELLQKNYEETDIYIRPFAYKADEIVGNFNLSVLKDAFCVYTVPMGRYLKADNGISANVSTWRRVPDNAIPPRAKVTGSYINTALAKTESLLNGYGEALFMDDHGHIVEGSAENIFVVKDGVIYTPPTADDILKGITRDTVMVLAENELKMPVQQKSIDRTEIYQADEVFLVGTGAEVTPVVEIDKRPVGDGKIGKVGQRMKDLYFQVTHAELPTYKNFVTKITKN